MVAAYNGTHEYSFSLTSRVEGNQLIYLKWNGELRYTQSAAFSSIPYRADVFPDGFIFHPEEADDKVGYLSTPAEYPVFILCQRDLSKPFWQLYVDNEDLYSASCFTTEVEAGITDSYFTSLEEIYRVDHCRYFIWTIRVCGG